MIDPAEIESYRLPPALSKEIFHDAIVPDQLEGLIPQDVPTVVGLIAPPGTGKSRLGAIIGAQLKQHGGFADIDSDLLKPYHPKYAALMAKNDELMAACTRHDGRVWMALLEEYIRKHKFNALIQETSQDPQATAGKLKAYRQAGARTEGVLMGVTKALSDQGIVSRYFEQVADRGQGRLTVQANADESFTGILALADLIDRDALLDLVSIYRRGESKPRYSNSLDDRGLWNGPPQLRTNLEIEHARPLTDAESREFVDIQLQLREAIHGRGPEWQERLARIEQNAIPLLKPADIQRLAPPTRPSTAAAKSRSTTTARKPNPPKHSPTQGPGSRQQPHQHRPDGPDTGRGRTR
ncbi:zeta toxin family protein [Streptomyces cinereoruber]|uniref:zeta toxin family protein n=1 Tax=Streptomyces cinereoruber TaxID=67260 RepID=UPI003C2D8035